jgi:predicted histidine transporter YuiF (NhaC family)
MFAGLLLAVFATYRKPRRYENRAVDTSMTDAVSDQLTRAHVVTIIAVVIVVLVQVLSESLALSALCGVLVMILGGAIPWKKVDDNFASGIRLMGMIAMIMLVAGGYAEVMKATGAVNALVEAAVVIMGGSKWIAAGIITIIGLLVTMGIGSSFSTVPVLAVLYVPLCSRMGFSPAATILLMSAAAALGDAGSPASDTTLGPTSGLNADGQHDHIWDTCVPTFIHFNIPLMLVSIVVSQFI